MLKLGAHSLSRDMQPAVTVDAGSEKRFILNIGPDLPGEYRFAQPLALR